MNENTIKKLLNIGNGAALDELLNELGLKDPSSEMIFNKVVKLSTSVDSTTEIYQSNDHSLSSPKVYMVNKINDIIGSGVDILDTEDPGDVSCVYYDKNLDRVCVKSNIRDYLISENESNTVRMETAYTYNHDTKDVSSSIARYYLGHNSNYVEFNPSEPYRDFAHRQYTHEYTVKTTDLGDYNEVVYNYMEDMDKTMVELFNLYSRIEYISDDTKITVFPSGCVEIHHISYHGFGKFKEIFIHGNIDKLTGHLNFYSIGVTKNIDDDTLLDVLYTKINEQLPIATVDIISLMNELSTGSLSWLLDAESDTDIIKYKLVDKEVSPDANVYHYNNDDKNVHIYDLIKDQEVKITHDDPSNYIVHNYSGERVELRDGIQYRHTIENICFGQIGSTTTAIVTKPGRCIDGVTRNNLFVSNDKGVMPVDNNGIETVAAYDLGDIEKNVYSYYSVRNSETKNILEMYQMINRTEYVHKNDSIKITVYDNYLEIAMFEWGDGSLRHVNVQINADENGNLSREIVGIVYVCTEDYLYVYNYRRKNKEAEKM